MKILMVNKFLYPRGGAETYMFKVGEYLEKMGHQVTYFGMYDEKNTVGNALNLSTTNMDFHAGGMERLLYPFRIVYSLEAKRKITQVIDDFQPDIVHLNNINFQLTPSVIDACRAKGVPMVQTAHDFQVVCPNHLLLNLQEKRPCERCVNSNKWACAKHKCIHGSLAKSVIGSIEGELYRHRNNYDAVSLYICPSEFMEKMLNREPRYQGKTVTLHNFLSLDDVPTSVEKKDYVLYFGRLAEEKGLDRFLQACKMLPNIPFVVAGSGPMEEELRRDAPANVDFVGFKTGAALRQLIAEARFSVYLPIWYENCPLSVLESQALGTPVLANRIGGIPELIRDGETGVLMDEFTAENYARNMEVLYADGERLAVMSGNCSNRRDMMTLSQYCTALEKLYSEVKEGKHA